MEQPKVLDRPYDERRIIVITDKLPAAVARSSASKWDIVASAASVALSVTLPGTGGLVIEAVKSFKDDGELIYPISMEQARGLRFPPGHPRKNVVYIGHPVDDGSYIPTADFHRFLFEHKVAEAQRLLRSLGAHTISVIHIEGWDRNAAAKLGLGLPANVSGADVEVGVDASRTDKTNHQILATMKLTPTGEPRIPENLVWTPHEPLWAEVADARMESGLEEFVIDVRSTDDFGVNAGLKALIKKTGLEAGGQFVEHTNTVWRLEGVFK